MPSPTVDTRKDKAAAKRALLRLEDLPAGWTEEDAAAPGGKSRCPAFRQARDDSSARATAPQFSNDNDDLVTHAVLVFPNETAASKAFARLEGKSARACFAGDVAGAIGGEISKQGGSVGMPKTAKLNVDPLGADAAAFRVTLSVSASGVDVDAYADVLFNRVGRAISYLALTSSFTEPEAELRHDTARAAVRRLEDVEL